MFTQRKDNFKGNNIAIRLFDIIEQKKTNLCVSVDCTTQEEFFKIVQAVGSHVCCIKVNRTVI
jgi:orotidine-5'-phosphate decarboxylase